MRGIPRSCIISNSKLELRFRPNKPKHTDMSPIPAAARWSEADGAQQQTTTTTMRTDMSPASNTLPLFLRLLCNFLRAGHGLYRMCFCPTPPMDHEHESARRCAPKKAECEGAELIRRAGPNECRAFSIGVRAYFASEGRRCGALQSPKRPLQGEFLHDAGPGWPWIIRQRCSIESPPRTFPASILQDCSSASGSLPDRPITRPPIRQWARPTVGPTDRPTHPPSQSIARPNNCRGQTFTRALRHLNLSATRPRRRAARNKGVGLSMPSGE